MLFRSNDKQKQALKDFAEASGGQQVQEQEEGFFDKFKDAFSGKDKKKK